MRFSLLSLSPQLFYEKFQILAREYWELFPYENQINATPFCFQKKITRMQKKIDSHSISRHIALNNSVSVGISIVDNYYRWSFAQSRVKIKRRGEREPPNLQPQLQSGRAKDFCKCCLVNVYFSGVGKVRRSDFRASRGATTRSPSLEVDGKLLFPKYTI